MASKYEALAEYLRRQPGAPIEMTFGEIERIVGELPMAARTYRAWWSNNTSFTHARNGWLAAGWKTAKVSMDGRTLTFIRVSTADRASPKSVLLSSVVAPTEVHYDMSPRLPEPGVDEPQADSENLDQILLAIQRYVDGEIVETELGRIIRKYWGKGR